MFQRSCHHPFRTAPIHNQTQSNMNNGFSSAEEDSRGPVDQMCCLKDDGEVCRNAAGNASYSKRIQKTVAQRRLKLMIAPNVSELPRNTLILRQG